MASPLRKWKDHTAKHTEYSSVYTFIYKCETDRYHFLNRYDTLQGFIFEDKVPETIQIHGYNSSMTLKTFGKCVVVLDIPIPIPNSLRPMLSFSFGSRIHGCHYVTNALCNELRNDAFYITRNYLFDGTRVHYNARTGETTFNRAMRPLKNIVQDLAQDPRAILMRRSNRDAKALAGPSDFVFEP